MFTEFKPKLPVPDSCRKTRLRPRDCSLSITGSSTLFNDGWMAGNDGVCCCGDDGGGGGGGDNGVGGCERNCWAGFNGSCGPDANGPLATYDGGGGNGCDGVNVIVGFCLNSFGSRTYTHRKENCKIS